jgi:chromosome segregation ATPase
MGNDDFVQQLGDLSGQLKSLMPTLERMEGRLHQAQIDAASAEARNQALRREFDDLKAKVSNRLAELYKKSDTIALEVNNLKNQNGNLKRDIKEAVSHAITPALARIGAVEAEFSALKLKNESVAKKVWDVVKILLAAGVGAGVSLLTR